MVLNSSRSMTLRRSLPTHFVFVVFDFGELVLLRVQPELLFALLVFKAQGIGVARAVLQPVATGTADARVGLDPRLRFVPGKSHGGICMAL